MPETPRAHKICVNALFLQPHLGGIGNYCFKLLEHFLDARPEWTFTLLTTKDAAENFRGLSPRLKIRSVPLSSRNARLIFFHTMFPFQLRAFDLIHSVGNMGLAFSPIPQIITLHDVYERVSPERFGALKRFLMAGLISASGRRSAKVITGSQNSRRDIEKFYPHLSEKLEVVPYGCKFPASKDVFNTGRKNFVFVGTLEPGKNLPLALRAFARFHRQHGERFLVIGAEGWNQSHLPVLLSELGIQSAVDFLGFVSDSRLQEILGSARALIQPSNYEGFGLPVIEAMACACPVISARNSGLLEAGGDAALFFETGDEQGLYEHMLGIKYDPALGPDCVRKGLAHAAKFTWEAAGATTLRIYDEVLSATPADFTSATRGFAGRGNAHEGGA